MRKKRKKIKDSELKGFKYLKATLKMLERLHDAGCARDVAGNRILHMDQYAALILFYMFNLPAPLDDRDFFPLLQAHTRLPSFDQP